MNKQMKIIILSVFVLIYNHIYSQYQIISEDTLIYNKEFRYKLLSTIPKNEFIYVGFDTLNKKQVYYSDSIELINNTNITKSNIRKIESGLWIKYFDKDFNYCSKEKMNFYKILNYQNGYSYQNIYLFNKKNKIINITKNYPTLNNDSISFCGFKVIYFNKKEKIKAIELKQFVDDTTYLKSFYFNYTTYFNNLYPKDFSFSDEKKEIYITKQFNKKNIIIYELLIDRKQKENYLIKKSRNGKKIKTTTYYKNENKFKKTISKAQK
jgi:hypothetical protein